MYLKGGFYTIRIEKSFYTTHKLQTWKSPNRDEQQQQNFKLQRLLWNLSVR